jgi:hypothetical protein
VKFLQFLGSISRPFFAFEAVTKFIQFEMRGETELWKEREREMKVKKRERERDEETEGQRERERELSLSAWFQTSAKEAFFLAKRTYDVTPPLTSFWNDKVVRKKIKFQNEKLSSKLIFFFFFYSIQNMMILSIFYQER